MGNNSLPTSPTLPIFPTLLTSPLAPMHGPHPTTRHPIPGVTRTAFLNTLITNPNIVVGDYTYYYDFEHPENFERNVLYHFDFIPRKSCGIAIPAVQSPAMLASLS